MLVTIAVDAEKISHSKKKACSSRRNACYICKQSDCAQLQFILMQPLLYVRWRAQAPALTSTYHSPAWALTASEPNVHRALISQWLEVSALLGNSGFRQNALFT